MTALNEPAEREAYLRWVGMGDTLYGERAWMERARIAAEREAKLREALEYLIERAGDSDDAFYGTLSTSFVRDVARAALAPEKGR